MHGASLFDEIVEPQRFLSRGINITVLSTGLRNKLVWNLVPQDLTSHAKHAKLE